jgi:hypothetical protein
VRDRPVPVIVVVADHTPIAQERLEALTAEYGLPVP